MHTRSYWKTVVKYFLLALALAAAVLGVNYAVHDQEHLELNDQIRRSLPGTFVHLATGTTHYELAGPADAPTVVLIHGFSIPDYLWDPTFRYLVSAGFRVLRYDLFGRGYSDRPRVTYDGKLFDRQLVDLLSALKISARLHVVGCSMGGSIAVSFAARHPERVRSVTLIGPGYLSGGRLPFRLGEPILGEYTMAVSVAPGLAESQREDLYHPERFPEYVEKYRPQMQYKGFRSALLSTLRHYIVADSSGDYRRLGQTGIPVLLIWGRYDRDVPLAVSEKIRAEIPKAQFHVIDDSAHVPHYEHPEVVNPILVTFLRRTEQQASRQGCPPPTVHPGRVYEVSFTGNPAGMSACIFIPLSPCATEGTEYGPAVAMTLVTAG